MSDLGFSIHQISLLHNRVDRVLRDTIFEQLEHFQITMNEWLLLGVVATGPKDGLTLSKVAEILDVSQPQVTAIMMKVSQQRLVKQKVSRKDRRNRYVMLTARGLRIINQIQETLNQRAGEWLGVLPAEMLENYIHTLEYMAGERDIDDEGVKIDVKKESSHE